MCTILNDRMQEGGPPCATCLNQWGNTGGYPTSIQSLYFYSREERSNLAQRPPFYSHTFGNIRVLRGSHPWVLPLLSPGLHPPCISLTVSSDGYSGGMVGIPGVPGERGWCIYQGSVPPHTLGGVYTRVYSSRPGYTTGCTSPTQGIQGVLYPPVYSPWCTIPHRCIAQGVHLSPVLTSGCTSLTCANLRVYYPPWCTPQGVLPTMVYLSGCVYASLCTSGCVHASRCTSGCM